MRRLTPLLLLAAFAPLPGGAQEPGYLTRNVIVAVMDGVRWCDTFGDPQRANVPNLARIAAEGVLFTDFRNEGVTITRQGHSTIATGTWQTCRNGGPRHTRPSFWEYARDELGLPPEACAVIFGKGRYSFAGASSFPGYGDRCPAKFEIDVGEAELPDDEKVLARVFAAMETDRPRVMFVNFGVTDHVAHRGPFERYVAAVRNCDALFGRLWAKVQGTDGYRDRTTVFFTNDHGRHDGRAEEDHGGYRSHGDDCEGCRHVMLVMAGPDVKRGLVSEAPALQIDLCPTVGELLGFQTPLAEGRVLAEALSAPRGLNRKEARTEAAMAAVRRVGNARRDLLRLVAEAQTSRDPAALPDDPGTALLRRGLLEAAALLGEERFADLARRMPAGRGTLPLVTGDDDFAGLSVWVEMAPAYPPMACDAAPRRPTASISREEVAGLLSAVDALAAAPRRLGLHAECLVRLEALADGIAEEGGTWSDPAVTALALACEARLRPIRRAHPVEWAPPAPQTAKQARRNPRPAWAHPEVFLRGAFPFALDRLLLDVSPEGHLGDGGPFADGALLLLLAEVERHSADATKGDRRAGQRR